VSRTTCIRVLKHLNLNFHRLWAQIPRTENLLNIYRIKIPSTSTIQGSRLPRATRSLAKERFATALGKLSQSIDTHTATRQDFNLNRTPLVNDTDLVTVDSILDSFPPEESPTESPNVKKPIAQMSATTPFDHLFFDMMM
jgi:hypothetical protein